MSELDDVWKIQSKLRADKLYGIKLTIRSGGKCETEFNYDPKCEGDPSFFNS